MIVTGKHLSRRTVLKGMASSIALPMLDAMAPAFAAQRVSAAAPRRLSVIYLPNGIRMEDWTPAADGHDFSLPAILAPLGRHRPRLTVVTGLRNGSPHYVVHGAASTRFLTTVPPAASTGSFVEAGVSMDQLAARAFGRDTQLASLELALESGFAGVCDVGASCVYTDTISWRGETTPLPMEHNPRVVFERLFGDSDTTDRAARLARMAEQRSILDSVTGAAGSLRRAVGADDRVRLDEYLEAVRDAERRIENAERQSDRDIPVFERPTGVPSTFPAHARLMFDLQLLAFRSDLTRVITFMTGRELSGRTYPEIGIRDAHHPLSHHENDPAKLARLTVINTHHMTQVAYFLDQLQSVTDGDGSLLEHTTVLCGAGMSDGNSHSPFNLPVLLAGGNISGGRHIRVPDETPIGNLHVTLLDKLGVQVERFGNSTGQLIGL